MNFIKTYKFRLSITLAIIAAFFVFQNGTCNSSSQNKVSTSGSTSSVTTTSSLVLSGSATTVAIGGTVQFTASGGTAPYYYSIFSGGGTINATTGIYTAPSYASTASISVQDAGGSFQYVSVIVGSGSGSGSTSITITPSVSTVALTGSVQLTAAGGTAPYTFLILSGGGSFTSTASSSAIYQAPNYTGTIQIQATDSLSRSGTVSLTVSGSASAGSTYKYASVSTSGAFDNNWRDANLLDNNRTSCFSSINYGSPNPGAKPWVIVTLGDATTGATGSAYTVNHIYFAARQSGNYSGSGSGSSYLAFPLNYSIKYLASDGSTWNTIGTYTAGPDFDGVVRVNFTGVVTKQLAIVANYLTTDGNAGNYYLQLCEIML